ncbi:hypothetical protein ABZ770_39165 [Streptomyces sp. NPDC006654]|uniref:hypothetical protein n=1 Tax=Streptomyces sp. NPDC006654 TaxID=3156897 RepID=UPI0033E89BD2
MELGVGGAEDGVVEGDDAERRGGGTSAQRSEQGIRQGVPGGTRHVRTGLGQCQIAAMVDGDQAVQQELGGGRLDVVLGQPATGGRTVGVDGCGREPRAQAVAHDGRPVQKDRDGDDGTGERDRIHAPSLGRVRPVRTAARQAHHD